MLFMLSVEYTEFAEIASTPPPGFTELPTCPICLGGSLYYFFFPLTLDFGLKLYFILFFYSCLCGLLILSQNGDLYYLL